MGFCSAKWNELSVIMVYMVITYTFKSLILMFISVTQSNWPPPRISIL